MDVSRDLQMAKDSRSVLRIPTESNNSAVLANSSAPNDARPIRIDAMRHAIRGATAPRDMVLSLDRGWLAGHPVGTRGWTGFLFMCAM